MTKKKEKGITLIALVVTIVVLLILAGISISMLTGENGVITQARKSKEATEQAKVEEHVSIALASVIAKNNGSTVGITPKMVADQVNEDESRTDVYAQNETAFLTYIIFPKENRKAEVNLNTGEFGENSIYSADVKEEDIAPMDLFDYEIIDDGSTGALTLDNLPTKTVRITRIKPKYCNIGGYNPDTKEYDLTSTNYAIIYNGTKISDTLIIPYQVDGKYVQNGIEGEYYKVTKVSFDICEKLWNEVALTSIPIIEELIFPNTINEISSNCEIDFNHIPETGAIRSGIKSVILSNNLLSIPDGFFANATRLEQITIPKSLTSIGKYAFRGCTGLTNIVIPDNVTNIEEFTFEDCSNLMNVIIGNNVTSIGNYAFDGCSSLTSVTIPDSVTSIGNGVFAYCKSLTSITIPDSVTSIGYRVFDGCSSLTSITIPGSVTSIGGNVFRYWSSITSITIEDGVTSIGDGAFEYCSSLASITIPDSVTSIEEYAFYECSSLTSITIPDSVTSIEKGVFYKCSSLTSITIPDSVTSIGYNAFSGCSSLTTVYYTGTKEQWNKISISSGNSSLTNATINYNYTGE